MGEWENGRMGEWENEKRHYRKMTQGLRDSGTQRLRH